MLMKALETYICAEMRGSFRVCMAASFEIALIFNLINVQMFIEMSTKSSTVGSVLSFGSKCKSFSKNVI